MTWRGELDHDRIGGLHETTGDYNSHDAGFAHEIAGIVTGEDRRHKTRLKPIQLGTRVTKPGDLDNRVRAKPQPGTARKSQQIDSLRGHVLTKIARHNVEAGRTKFFEELAMDEVDLAQVRLRGVARHTRPMPNRGAKVRVAFNTETLDETDEQPR